MHPIKSLAPTIFDAIKAIEQGIRKTQNDPLFTPTMGKWMTITPQVCMGCLATSTLMQLTTKSAKDFVEYFSKEELPTNLSRAERSECYGFKVNVDNGSYSELVDFEFAIDFMRAGDIKPLLAFYSLHRHTNANEAAEWFRIAGIRLFDATLSNADLITYADFLKNTLLPKFECWFK